MKFAVIIAIAIFLRFVNLSNIPVGFNDDEAAFGYNAYSILKTAKDEWGRVIPFPVFESFGDWKLIGYLYMTVISVSLFGLNEFATRFPSAFFGVLTVAATYLLARELFKDSKWKLEIGKCKLEIPQIAMLLVAISPWQIIASRNAFESDLLSFFITFATYLFIKSLKKGKYINFSMIFFGLSLYIYRSAWLFIPLFLITISYLHQKESRQFKWTFLKSLIIVVIFALPLIPSLLSFKGQSRFIQESFITGSSRIGIINDVNSYRGICTSHLPQAACSLIYNKYIFFTKSYVANYFKNLSYSSFFDKASYTGFQSFSQTGVFYLFELPLIIFGFIYLFSTKHQSLKILLPWILLSPVGASIVGVGNYGRFNLIMPAPQIIAAVGIFALISQFKNKTTKIIAKAVVVIIIGFSLAKLTSDLFYVEPYFTSRYQRYGYKELFHYLQARQNEYENFYISQKIDYSHQYIQYLFFEKVDPNYFLANVQRTHAEDGWVNVQKIGKFVFTTSAPGLDQVPYKSLVIIGEKEVSLSQPPIRTIKYLNADVGFEIYSNEKIE